MSDDKGVFTLSLDTELAWGTFDVGRTERHKEAYRRTPEVIDRLCTLFDEYEIPATWAVVSHLLVDCNGDHRSRTHPDFEWIDDWFGGLPCATGLDKQLWYAPWLLERIQACETNQEIGLHGATHMQLGADGCSTAAAKDELTAAVETLRDHGIEPESFVFPRNDIGHLDVLSECGIDVYRAVDARWYERRVDSKRLKPPLRFFEELTRRPPPVVDPVSRGPLVSVPGSQAFRPRQGGWKYTPAANSVARAKKGLRLAASTGRVFHLWFHPFNLGHEPETDLTRLEAVLEAVHALVQQGELTAKPMCELERRVVETNRDTEHNGTATNAQ